MAAAPELPDPDDTTDALAQAYRQAEAYAQELHRLYREHRATRAELEARIREVEHYQQQLLAYARDLAAVYQRLEGTYLATLEALARAVESRDYETGGHSQRVVHYAVRTGQQFGLKPAELKTLRYGALLHDMGKIAIPDAVLLKPGRLDAREWEIMRRHPEIGYWFLQDIEFLAGALPIVRYHHERFDGRGYPAGLAGEAIPLGARIFSVADAFDAMTADRPYRQGLPVEVALEEIRRGSGSQFDPQIVEAFLAMIEQAQEIRAGRSSVELDDG